MLLQSRTLPDQPAAVRRGVLVPDQLTDWVPEACAQVAAYLFRHQIAFAHAPV